MNCEEKKAETIRLLKIEIEDLTRQIRKRRDEMLVIQGEIKAMEERLGLKPCESCKKRYSEKNEDYCEECRVNYELEYERKCRTKQRK